MLLDENENILDSISDTELEKIKEWFEESYRREISVGGDNKFPDNDLMFSFINGYDIDRDFTKVIDEDTGETDFVRRTWRLVWSDEDGTIDFYNLTDEQYDFLLKRYNEEVGRDITNDDELLLKYGLRFNPSDFKK